MMLDRCFDARLCAAGAVNARLPVLEGVPSGVGGNIRSMCSNVAFPSPMALHHINGDRLDNRIENLELLCPTVTARRIRTLAVIDVPMPRPIGPAAARREPRSMRDRSRDPPRRRPWR